MRTTSRRLGALCAITLTIALAVSVGALIGFQHLGNQIFAGDDLVELELAQRDVVAAIVDEETGVRDYVATGDDRFLDTYVNGRHAIVVGARARDASAAAARMASNAAALRVTSDELQTYFAEEVRLVASGQRARATVDLTLGKVLIDRYRRLDAELQQRAKRAALERTRATRAALHRAHVLALGTLALLGLLGIAFIPLVRSGAGFERDALRDTVTPLANRRAFLDRLNERCREPKPFAVALIDLDGFKAINDTLGHATGDRILLLIGQRLRAHLRVDDFAARLGGDEFAILLDGIASRDAGSRTIARLCASIERPSTAEAGQIMQVGASAGFSLYPTDARDGAALLAVADSAMYAHKDHRRRRSDQGGAGVAALEASGT